MQAGGRKFSCLSLGLHYVPAHGSCILRGNQIYLEQCKGWEDNDLSTNCETCVNYVYDEEYDDNYCCVNLDEDELVRFLQDSHYQCPYYRLDDEYAVVRKQM